MVDPAPPRVPTPAVWGLVLLAIATGIFLALVGISSASNAFFGFDAPPSVSLPALGLSAIVLSLGVGCH